MKQTCTDRRRAQQRRRQYKRS